MNKKYPLKIFAVVSLVIIVIASIITGVLGVHSSIEIGGGSQIAIQTSYENADHVMVDGRENVNAYLKKVKPILSKHGAYVDSYFVEDKLTDTYLVIRMTKQNLKDVESIKTEIATELDIDAARISDVQKIDSYFSNKTMLFVGLAILAIIVIAFFIGLFRYGIVGGTSLLFAIMHNIIMSLALIFLTRAQLSMIGIVSIIALTVIGIFAYVYMLEQVREDKKSKQYQDYSHADLMITATKKNKAIIFMAAAIVIVSIVLALVPINHIRFAGLSMFLSTIAAAYTFFGISPAIHAALSEIQSQRQKDKLSTNVKPAKTKKTK